MDSASSLTALLAAVELSAPVAALRGSVWAYPWVNAGHILGVSLLFGAIVPLDLKLLGMWPSLPLAPLQRVLTRTAAVGLGLASTCGALLFATRARAYADSYLFLSKMIVVAIGVGNALLVHMGARNRRRSSDTEGVPPSPALRLAAWFSR